MPEEINDSVQYITNDGKAKYKNKWYFIKASNRDSAKEIARIYHRPVPQRAEEWSVVCACEKGAQVPVHGRSYEAPFEGYVMKLNMGSAW